MLKLVKSLFIGQENSNKLSTVLYHLPKKDGRLSEKKGKMGENFDSTADMIQKSVFTF